MNRQQLAAARAVIEGATAGPWCSYEGMVRVGVGADAQVHGPVVADCCESRGYWRPKEMSNGHMIAASRTGWPAALDALEKAWGALEEITGGVECFVADDPARCEPRTCRDRLGDSRRHEWCHACIARAALPKEDNGGTV